MIIDCIRSYLFICSRPSSKRILCRKQSLRIHSAAHSVRKSVQLNGKITQTKRNTRIWFSFVVLSCFSFQVVFVDVVDTEYNDAVTVQFLPSEDYNPFRIITSPGGGRVILDQALQTDREFYNLTLQASDRLGHTSQAQLLITIYDVNDHTVRSRRKQNRFTFIVFIFLLFSHKLNNVKMES